MVVLKSPGTLPARTLIHGTDVTDIVGFVLGTAGYGQLGRFVDVNDATNYSVIAGNKDTTNGRALKIQYGDNAGSPTSLATFAKAAITIELPLTVKQVDLTAPSTGYTRYGARASDGAPVFWAAGGSQTLIANAADSPSTILTTTGDTLYASSASVAARLAIGSTNQVLTVTGGLPVWAAGSKATLTTTGDLLYASAANTLARLAVGSTNQGLYVSGGLPVWSASTKSTLTTTGDVVYASSANTLARLAVGSTNQMLSVTGGVPAWKASSTSTLTTTGDLLYASSANTLARLAIGTTNFTLNVVGGVPSWQASPTSILTASGDTLYASGANTLARLAKGADGTVLTLASGLPTWATATAASVANKNRLINGDMRIWQRGTTSPTTADNTYAQDRWRLLLAAANAATIQIDTADIPAGGSRSNAAMVVGSGNNNKFGIFQIAEGTEVWDLRGQSASLSFSMKATAGISDVRAAVVQWTGTEDNGGTLFPDPINVWGATATVPTYTGSWANANTPANLSPTTSWAAYTIPSISISASMTNLAVFIWSEDTTTTTSTDILRVTDVQLEKSTAVTPFERRRLADELVLCQRYYCKTFPQGTAPAQAVGSVLGALYYVTQVATTAGPSSAAWAFPVVMRATPAITTYNPSASNALWRNASVGADSGTPSTVNLGDRGCSIFNPQVAGDVAGSQISIHATADKEL